MKWEVVIGLEVHTQLTTKSKIFSPASTAFGAAPNTQTAVVDIALPGALPVMNRAAVEKAIQFGLAIGANVKRRSVFDRKNYFYPDLPKGYQISQMDLPIVEGGVITIQIGDEERKINLTRAHLEEDAGKSLHEDYQDMTGIDLNRAGTPLLEIVSEPEMRSSAEAVAYAKALYELVTWIGICDGNMSEGSFRVDANVSVRPVGQVELGTRREIKNLNSFKFLQQAIDYEIRWQIETIEDGGRVVQGTVLFDPDKGETRMMRSKEDAHDYRYFPDPDLPPLVISEEWIARVQGELPELPVAMQARFIEQYGISAYDARMLTTSKILAAYFEAVVACDVEPKIASNWLTGEVSAMLNRDGLSIENNRIESVTLGAILIRLIDKTINANGVKYLLLETWENSNEQFKESWNDIPNFTLTHAQKYVDELIGQLGIKQENDVGAIEAIVDAVLAANSKAIEEYRSGKEKALNALVGQVMKGSGGKANPAMALEMLKKKVE